MTDKRALVYAAVAAGGIAVFLLSRKSRTTPPAMPTLPPQGKQQQQLPLSLSPGNYQLTPLTAVTYSPVSLQQPLTGLQSPKYPPMKLQPPANFKHLIGNCMSQSVMNGYVSDYRYCCPKGVKPAYDAKQKTFICPNTGLEANWGQGCCS